MAATIVVPAGQINQGIERRQLALVTASRGRSGLQAWRTLKKMFAERIETQPQGR